MSIVPIMSVFQNIFILNYLLNNEIGLKLVLKCFERSWKCLKSVSFLAFWLTLSFVQDKELYSNEHAVISSVINTEMDKSRMYTLCQILLRLGFDVDDFKHNALHGERLSAPIFIAIREGNIDIFRLLIYHCCNLDIQTTGDLILNILRF